MATHDVPGANPANRDVLAIGCWAEHEDGSLIYVKGLEGGDVIYSIYDVALDPAVEYSDAMPESGFKSQFSFPGRSGERWTWHDKTSFPWDRVMENFPSGQRAASAAGQLSAAARVAESLQLRAQRVRDRGYRSLRPQNAARGIMERIRAAVGELRR